MASMEVEVARAIAQGDVENNSGFENTAIRSVDATALEKGDVWTFPTVENFKVYDQIIGEGENARKLQYIWITMEDGPSKGLVKRFYPNIFNKTRALWEMKNGTPSPVGRRVHTTGSAAIAYQACASVPKGMAAVAGKKCHVTNMNMILTMPYGRTTLDKTGIPQIDFVE